MNIKMIMKKILIMRFLITNILNNEKDTFNLYLISLIVNIYYIYC